MAQVKEMADLKKDIHTLKNRLEIPHVLLKHLFNPKKLMKSKCLRSQ